MEGVRCVLFDLDGTLVDSVPAYYDLMAAMLDAVGLPQVPRATVAEFMTGGPAVLEKMIPAAMASRRRELTEKLLGVGRPLSLEMFRERVQVFPGVGPLFRALAARGMPIGLVTSTQRHFIEQKLMPLERAGLRQSLKVIITTDDAARRKPAPDPLLEGARRVGVPAAECIYVGDSHVDIRAGQAARMRTVAVLSGLDDAGTLTRENPTLVLDSVGDLHPWLP